MVKNKKFVSVKRAVWAAAISIVLVICSFNFNQRNVAVLATRTLSRQIMDYALNLVIFFLVVYLLLTFFAYLISLFTRRTD